MKTNENPWTPKLKDETLTKLNDEKNFFVMGHTLVNTDQKPVDKEGMAREFKNSFDEALEKHLAETPFTSTDYDFVVGETNCCCYLVVSREKGDPGTLGRILAAQINFSTIEYAVNALDLVFKIFRDDLYVLHSHSFRDCCNPQRKDIIALMEGWQKTCRADCECIKCPW